MSISPDLSRDALDILKGKENPFESLARPQRIDDRFRDLHVPELLAEERALLLQIVDSYRVEEYTKAADLSSTRVVTIRGDRGSGKTHLLQSLAYRDDGKSQILVRPTYFDGSLPFGEYLLSQLVQTLLGEDEVYRTRPIDDVANVITRRLLHRAITSLGPTEQIFAIASNPWKEWHAVLWGSSECQRIERLTRALSPESPNRDVMSVLKHSGLDPQLCLSLIEGHLKKFECGLDLTSGLRQHLYAAMARAVLLSESDQFYQMLEGEYPHSGHAPNARNLVVESLLHSLVEICALVRQPVVFAFDNLERLFSPSNAFDGELVRSFWNALAQAVDNTRGLLILLFAESGLLERILSFKDDFAEHRVTQGVPIRARGPVHLVTLKLPDAEHLRLLVRNRVRKLLAGFPGENLPETFPFDEKTFQDAISEVANMRTALIRLRDHYSRLVYGQASAEKPPAGIHWASLLEAQWNKHQSTADSLDGSLAPHLQKIHNGFNALLRLCLPLDSDHWTLRDVQPIATVGDHPTYGVVSLLDFQVKEAALGGKDTLRVGVGFLLSRGTGMHVDLDAKFDFFRRPSKGDRLLVFWPAQDDADGNLVEQLPPGTRSVWDGNRNRKKATLRRIEQADLRVLWALPDWLSSVQSTTEEPVPEGILLSFAKEHFESLLQLIEIPVFEEEKVTADENR